MPKHAVEGGKRYPLGMRTTKEIRERLESAASESGRSLAQEVEYRLERSFDREQWSTELLAELRKPVTFTATASAWDDRMIILEPGQVTWFTTEKPDQ